MAVMDKVETNEQKVYEEYIDPAELIIEYGKNPQYGAIPLYYTISEIVAETGITFDEAVKIATQYSGVLGNPAWVNYYGDSTVYSLSNYNFGAWRVPVLYAAYKTVNRKYFTKKKNRLYSATWGVEKNTESKQTVVSEFQTIYHSYRIMDTDFIWGQGVMNDVPRPSRSDAVLPFHLFILPASLSWNS